MFMLTYSDCFGPLRLSSVSDFNALQLVYTCLLKLCHAQSLNKGAYF